jgi:hypothetical protein
MHEPYAHTLSPVDRQFISRWLLRISATFGALTLLVVGFAIANHHGDTDRQNETSETAAMQANQR